MKKYANMSEVRRAFPLWFSPGAMRFFQTRVESEVLGGRFFVTSERRPTSHSARARGDDPGPRRYSVRCAAPDGIDTVGDFMGYSNKTEAVQEARRLALVSQAAEATEHFTEDELEAHADKLKSQEDK